MLMACLIFVIVGCQKGEDLSIIEATPTTVGEEGSYKGAGNFSNTPMYMCTINNIDDPSCMGPNDKYAINLWVASDNTLELNLERNPNYTGNNSSDLGVLWQIDNSTNWHSCGYSSTTVGIGATQVKLRAYNAYGSLVVSSDFCFYLDADDNPIDCANGSLLEVCNTGGLPGNGSTGGSGNGNNTGGNGGVGGTMTIIMP